ASGEGTSRGSGRASGVTGSSGPAPSARQSRELPQLQGVPAVSGPRQESPIVDSTAMPHGSGSSLDSRDPVPSERDLEAETAARTATAAAQRAARAAEEAAEAVKGHAEDGLPAQGPIRALVT